MSPIYSNITISVPAGTTNHGDPHLICIPSNWTSILLFFLANYVSHVATVLSLPGQRASDYAYTMLRALLVPTTGCGRGLDAIIRFANLGTDDLTKAARAGALYMVIRKEADESRYSYNPNDPGAIQKYHRKWWLFRGFGPTKDLQRWVTIHGVSRQAKLPDDYLFATVPRNARVVAREKNASFASGNSAFYDNPDVKISTSSNAAKVIIAIFQTVYGSLTPYRARGDQLDQYGYAAFGLTVTPYVVMSILNLVGCLMTPSYPTAYLVHSAVLEELRKEEAHPYFDGTVGTLVEPDTAREIQQQDSAHARRAALVAEAITLGLKFTIASGIPLCIIGIISHFQKGRSTLAQRMWMMSWLSLGGASLLLRTLSLPAAASGGPEFQIPSRHQLNPDDSDYPVTIWNWIQDNLLHIFAILAACPPAVGGFVVVSQMLKTYGDCIRFA